MSGGKGLSVFEVEFLSCLVWIYTFKINLLLKLQTCKQRQKHHQHKTVFKQCSSNTSLRCNFTKNMSWFTESFFTEARASVYQVRLSLEACCLCSYLFLVLETIFFFLFLQLYSFYCLLLPRQSFHSTFKFFYQEVYLVVLSLRAGKSCLCCTLISPRLRDNALHYQSGFEINQPIILNIILFHRRVLFSFA